MPNRGLSGRLLFRAIYYDYDYDYDYYYYRQGLMMNGEVIMT